jgi:hypothetical protein
MIYVIFLFSLRSLRLPRFIFPNRPHAPWRTNEGMKTCRVRPYFIPNSEIRIPHSAFTRRR